MFAQPQRAFPTGGVSASRNAARSGIVALAAGLLLFATSARVAADQPHADLRVYGPGGPHEVLSECATVYRLMHGETVSVVRGRPGYLDRVVELDGDLFYGGAEFMLRDFDRRNPGVLDLQTVELLYPRQVGIIVRKGNPRGIRSLADLDRGGIRVMKAALENMHEFHGEQLADRQSSLPEPLAGSDALKAWRSDPTIDAWITYRSWHRALAAEAEFIEVTAANALRFTPIAITAATPHREMAERFIAFLKSPQAKRIFAEHGWD